MCARPKRWAGKHRVAVVQHPPVTLHRQKTLERGIKLLEEAAAAGAKLVSFPETWLPGYPETVVAFRNGNIVVIANTGGTEPTLPEGVVGRASAPVIGTTVPHHTAVWLRGHTAAPLSPCASLALFPAAGCHGVVQS